MMRRLIASTVVSGSAILGFAVPALATGLDGEDRGKPMPLIQVLGLFVGVPALVIGTIYFIAFVPKRKADSAPSSDIALR